MKAEGSGHQVAVLHLNTMGDGVLELTSGAKRYWSSLRRSRQERAFVDGDLPLVRVRRGIGGALDLTIADETWVLWELPILVMLAPS